MFSGRWRRSRAGILAALALLGCGSEPTAGELDTEQTRGIMKEIFTGLRGALPASVDPAKFRDPASQAQITAALELLTRNASTLERHVQSQDAQLRYLARSIASDAREIERSYAEERYERSSFLLQQIAENCIACHTRLPAQEDPEVSANFVSDEVFDELALEPRATLLMATRRFDEALDVLEALLADPGVHAATLLGPLTDYLVVSIRVKGDYARPVPVLERFAARHDVWTKLRLDVEGWLDALPQLEKQAAGAPSVAKVRAILAEGDRLDAVPGDHGSLAHLVVASALLERFIATHHRRDAELAEAYYLLGVVESRIGRNYWVTRAPFLLAESIRIDPAAATAARAYALLERELLRSYEGSDFEELPAEDREHLESLRALISH